MGFRKVPFKKIYTDEQGHPIDKHGNRINVEELDIPMWRSYGVHKIHRPWLTGFNELLARAIAILFLSPIFFSAAMVIFLIYYYAQFFPIFAIIALAFTLFALFLFCKMAMRIPRKRAKFYRKIKRFCKKNGYTLTIKRNCFSSLRWMNDETVDLIIEAEDLRYYVKLFGCRKNSDVTFCHNGDLVYRKLPPRAVWARLLALSPKTRIKRIVFPELPECEGVIKAIVLCPVSIEMYKKRLNKDTELTGNHDELFGYTVFTESGFTDAVRRTLEKKKWDIENGRA